MPNLARSSATVIRSVRASSSRVSVAGTAASGTCVVASATRKGPHGAAPTSIMTTVDRVRSARNSVCPVNATPASLITLFCTGAVTIAAKPPVRHPASAASSVASTDLAFAGSSRPGTTGAASGKCTTSNAYGVPGLLDAYGTKRTPARSLRARSRKSSMSPKATSRAGQRLSASRTHKSGPMPAGSPIVTAIFSAALIAR